MKDTYRIADIAIEISSLHDRVHRLCADYRAEGVPAVFLAEITQSDIEHERACSIAEYGEKIRTSRRFSDSYLEELAVYRKIAERMPAFDTVLMHGSCVAVDGEGYLFTAPSGTGKSTHARLWRERFGSRAVMINDDKPLIRVTEAGATIYGTPWNGKHHLSTDCAVPLKAICVLERAEHNTIRRIAAAEAYPTLLQQIYRPADTAARTATLRLIDRLTSKVDFWKLDCNMDPEAAQIAYDAMKGNG